LQGEGSDAAVSEREAAGEDQRALANPKAVWFGRWRTARFVALVVS
jgi:hypothetical protein